MHRHANSACVRVTIDDPRTDQAPQTSALELTCALCLRICPAETPRHERMASKGNLPSVVCTRDVFLKVQREIEFQI